MAHVMGLEPTFPDVKNRLPIPLADTCIGGTPYRIRTGDLRRERALSLTTRPMEHYVFELHRT